MYKLIVYNRDNVCSIFVKILKRSLKNASLLVIVISELQNISEWLYSDYMDLGITILLSRYYIFLNHKLVLIYTYLISHSFSSRYTELVLLCYIQFLWLSKFSRLAALDIMMYICLMFKLYFSLCYMLFSNWIWEKYISAER